MNIKSAKLILWPVFFTLMALAQASTSPLILIPADGSPPDAKTVQLNRTLLVAAGAGSVSWVKMLLHDGANINVIEDYSKTYTPLTYAAVNRRVAMTKFLLTHGADPNAKGVKLSPLFWTISTGETPRRYQCVKILLEYGADPQRDCDGVTRPIGYAAIDGDVDIVKLLIHYMPQLTHNQIHLYLQQVKNVALDKAIISGTLSRIKGWVRAGANVNNLDGNDDAGTGSPLMRATSRGSLPIMNYLLARGARVNLQDEGGRTALMCTGCASEYYHIVMPGQSTPATGLDAAPTRLLLQHGANVALRDKSGMTALMYAAQGNPQATALLIAHGASVNAQDQTGRTALLWAAAIRDDKSLAILLAHGAQINKPDKSGETALMLASVMPDAPYKAATLAARRNAISLLRQAGADIRLKDKQGKTALAYTKLHDADFVDGG